MYEIRYYVTPDGVDVFQKWYERLRDSRAKLAVDRRLLWIEQGNFGDHKSCGDGVWELRIDFGPGYRVYYAPFGETIVVVLGGGDKVTQQLDIERAAAYLKQLKKERDDADKKS